MHLGVAALALVLGRAGRWDQGGVHHGAGLEQQAALVQQGVDDGQGKCRDRI